MPRIIISEPDKTPQPYRLKTDRIVTKIGRGSDNDVIITTGSASTYHCKMKRVEGGFTLVDNDSTNGIKYDGTRYSVIDLKDGMTVLIGDDIEMEFTLSEDEQELLSHEDFEPHQKISFPKSKKESKPKKESKEDDEDEIVLEEAKTKSKSKNKPSDDDDDEEVVLKEAPKKSKSNSKDKPSSDDDAPKPKLKADSDSNINNRPAATSKPVATNSGLSFIVFIILAILFFTGGLAIRHYQDHKTFIFSK